MIVIGIDPGSQNTGYSALKFVHNSQPPQLLEMGSWNLIKESQSDELGQRLQFLHEKITTFIRKWNPHVIGLEKAVTHKNIPSALTLSEARGVIRLSLHQNLDSCAERLFEISPTEIKKISTGSGRANKEEILKVLYMRIPDLRVQLSKLPKQVAPDASDAVAIAWTAHTLKRRKIHGNTFGAALCR